ncbi:MAG: (2Fe-2S) ferredoxin domain-containing protein [Myxococcota bacterium]
MSRKARYVFVCTKRRPDDHKKGSCALHGGEELVRSLKQAALAAKVDCKVTSSGCFDLCWVGAAVAVMPDNVFLKRIELGDIDRVVHALDAETTAELEAQLADHVAHAPDFIDPNKAS